jgi:serine/threonine protein kinase
MEPETIIKQALGSRYEIQSVIGKGGMATVYKAIQKSLNRPVALKVIHQNLAHDEEFISRFLREAQVCASLNHLNIVTIYDVDSVGTVHFISMEYLEGMTLRDLIKSKKNLSAEDTVRYIAPVADVLGFMHRYGLIHRDVKSSNIFITKGGRPVLMDFGIVFSEDRDPLSHDGSILGTPEYMSPEQAEGKVKIDGRSDIYSLGVILFECLTGGLPFHSDNYITTLHHVLHNTPPSVTSINTLVPKWISSIVAACLVKDRSMRIKDGNTLANALRNKEKVKIPTSAPEQHTRKITPEDIKDTWQNDVTEENTRTGKNRNTVLMSLIITIAIIILILGLLTFGPSQIASNSGVGISNRHPSASKPIQPNQASTQRVQPPARTGIPAIAKPDPAVEKRASIQQAIALGDKLLLSDSCESAIKKYQNALILDPDNFVLKQKISQAKTNWIQSLIIQGDNYLNNKNYNKALSSYNKGKDIDPTNIGIQQKMRDAKDRFIQSFINQGDTYLRDKEYELAIKSYEEGMQIDSSNIVLKQRIKEARKYNAQSFIIAGDANLQTHEYDLAIDNYNFAKQIEPGNNAINSKIQYAKKEKQQFENNQVVADERSQLDRNLKQLGIAMILVESAAIKNFYMGECEVTQKLWKNVMGSNPSYNHGEMLPVENVSYNDIQNFINKLNQITKITFRLPSEAEWQFAARGGNRSQNFKYSGSVQLSEVAWYDNNSNNSIHTVMSLRKNELGFYDMSGNVWEWCSTSDGGNMVLKGGCWLSQNIKCTIISREAKPPNHRDYSTGFRLCRNAD